MVSSRFLNGVGCARMESDIYHQPRQEETVMNITTEGLDLAKKA